MALDQLPDIDTESWQQYTSQRFQVDTDQQLQDLQVPPPPPPPAPAEALARIGNWATTPPPASEPAPPAPDGFGATTDAQISSLQPSPPPPPAPSTAPAPSDWFGDALTAAEQAGANVQQFADDLGQRVGQTGAATADAVGHALTSVANAGGDVQRFADALPALPQPPAQPASQTPLTQPQNPPSGVQQGGDGTSNVMADYIRQAALQRGIDPDIAVRVAASEGLNTYVGDQGSSFGPFQLHYGNVAPGGNAVSGLGDAFTKQTGLDARDPTTWQAQVDFALDQAARTGWGPWHGAARAGIGDRQGIGAQLPGPVQAVVDVGQRAAQAVGDVAQRATSTLSNLSQFGDPQLTASEAAAACGPAASVRFAQLFGRNPTLREATDLAKGVGWTPQQGMAGIASEQALMQKMGVPTRLISGADWSAFAREAQTGNPVTISTSGHYFTADGYDPTTNRFHVGRSGLDLKGGAEWMTPEQMTRLMGSVQGGLIADAPTVPAPSTADPLQWLGAQKDALGSSLGGAVQSGLDAAGETAQRARSAASSLLAPVDAGVQQLDSAVQQAASAAPASSVALQPAVGPDAAVGPPGGLSAGGAPPSGLNPLEAVKQKFSDALDALGGLLGGATGALSQTQAVRNVTGTNPDQADVEQRFADAQAAAQHATGATVQVPTNPLDLLGSASPYGVGSAGEQLAEERNRAIEQANPLRDVPVVGGASTFAAQTALDPTNLVLAGEPGIARAGARAAEAGAARAGEAVTSPAVRRFIGEEEGTLRLPGGPSSEPTSIFGPRGEVLSTVEPSTAVAADAATVAPERAGNILLPKFVQEPVRELIAETQAADPVRFEAARRGVVSDDTLRELAEQAGTNVNRIVGLWKPGQAKNAETLLAMRQGLADRALRVRAAQRALQEAPNSIDARATLVEALAQHAAIQEAVAGTTGEAGRALRALRQPIEGEEASLRLLQKLAREKGLTPQEMADVLTRVDLDDPVNVAVTARLLNTHTVMDKATALWYFNLLSNPLTHVKNAVSNALVLATRPVESLAAAGVDVARYGAQRGIERARNLPSTARRERYFGETPEVLFGYASALPDALRSAYRTLRTGVSDAMLANPELRGRGEAFSGRLADLTVNVPGRALQASDEMFRGMHTQATLRQLAYRQARQEGLRGQALADRITELIVNPSQKLVGLARAEGAYRVFQQDGTFVNAMARLRHAAPALNIPLPFVQTPYNVAKYALERTPLGLVKVGMDPKGGGVLSDRLARVGLGSATMAYFLNQAAQGNITGAAPRDPTERDAFYRQGKQPYSVKIGDTYRSYQALQPLTTLLSSVAGYADANRSAGESGADQMTAVAAGGLAMGRGLVEQPWLQGVSDLIDLMSGTDVHDPDDVLRTVNKYLQQQATSVIPAIVRATARAQDPTLRDPEQGPRGIAQALAANLPGLQSNAPPRLTAWGEDSKRAQTGPGVLIDPTTPSRITDSPLELEFERLQKLGYDVQPGFVSNRMTAFHTPVKLSEQQQRQYQRLAGSITHELLELVVGTPEWEALSDQQKVETVQKVTDRVRAEVRRGIEPTLLDQAIDVQIREAKQHAGVSP